MINIADSGLPQDSNELILLLEDMYKDEFPDMVTESKESLLVLQGKIELVRWLRHQQDMVRS